MRVRVLTRMPGYAAGSIVDVDDATASSWLGRGDAETVDALRQEPVEHATADPQGETAVSTPRRTRRG